MRFAAAVTISRNGDGHGTGDHAQEAVMNPLAVAFYARVSSAQQAQSQTIASQVAALRDHISQANAVLRPAHEFIEQGYSGSTLIRPALEHPITHNSVSY
jgi:hypothetical protein